MKFFTKCLGWSATLLACMTLGARAQITFNIPTPLSIPDSPASSPYTVTAFTDAAPAISSVTGIQINVQHDWLSDLTVKIFPPSSSSAFVLFDRVPEVSVGPDTFSATLGTVVSGGGGLVLAPQTYTFAASGADFIAAAQDAALHASGAAVPAIQTYGAATWLTGPFSAGAWRIEVTDCCDVSGGSLVGAQFDMVAVPEPGESAVAAGVLLLGALVVRRIRQSRGSVIASA